MKTKTPTLLYNCWNLCLRRFIQNQWEYRKIPQLFQINTFLTIYWNKLRRNNVEVLGIKCSFTIFHFVDVDFKMTYFYQKNCIVLPLNTTRTLSSVNIAVNVQLMTLQWPLQYLLLTCSIVFRCSTADQWLQPAACSRPSVTTSSTAPTKETSGAFFYTYYISVFITSNKIENIAERLHQRVKKPWTLFKRSIPQASKVGSQANRHEVPG